MVHPHKVLGIHLPVSSLRIKKLADKPMRCSCRSSPITTRLMSLCFHWRCKFFLFPRCRDQTELITEASKIFFTHSFALSQLTDECVRELKKFLKTKTLKNHHNLKGLVRFGSKVQWSRRESNSLCNELIFNKLEVIIFSTHRIANRSIYHNINIDDEYKKITKSAEIDGSLEV